MHPLLRGALHGFRRRRRGRPDLGIRVSGRLLRGLRNSFDHYLGIGHRRLCYRSRGFRLANRGGFQRHLNPVPYFLILYKQALFQQFAGIGLGHERDLVHVARLPQNLVGSGPRLAIAPLVQLSDVGHRSQRLDVCHTLLEQHLRRLDVEPGQLLDAVEYHLRRLKRSLDVLLVQCGSFLVHRKHPLTFCLMAAKRNIRNLIDSLVLRCSRRILRAVRGPVKLFYGTA